MEPELEHRLQCINKTQLILLVQELTARHPQLLTEVSSLLEQVDVNTSSFFLEESGDEDVNEKKTDEDWDFNGEIGPTYKTLPRSRLLPLDLEAYQQRFASYDTIEIQEETYQQIDQELMELLKEGEERVDHRDYHAALDLFALLINARIAETNPALSPLFDQAIDEGMPTLETLLSEVSSHILFDTAIALSPLLSSPMRREWLERLFVLWLKRLDRYHSEEELPEIILDIAWSDDVALLRERVMKELHFSEEHTNIVDLTRQYRTRALEKFLKELPHI
ncbi:MAG TPA: hypothetical protein VL485_11055 [Ktedonobacteraceae bacterium]|jgi:hypothetical protein|nr:hypothetical protein [Ktedonobacteraceae bacterium]